MITPAAAASVVSCEIATFLSVPASARAITILTVPLPPSTAKRLRATNVLSLLRAVTALAATSAAVSPAVTKKLTATLSSMVTETAPFATDAPNVTGLTCVAASVKLMSCCSMGSVIALSVPAATGAVTVSGVDCTLYTGCSPWATPLVPLSSG